MVMSCGSGNSNRTLGENYLLGGQFNAGTVPGELRA